MAFFLEEQRYLSRNNRKVMIYKNEDEVKWLKHYASFHRILLVGEGDFSFSLCLARAFGSASNIVATSLDSYDALIRSYKNAESNLQKLLKLGATILHNVDATNMMLHTDLKMRKFDRIIFNFPHAGFHGKENDQRLITKHRSIVNGFFRNASHLLRVNGEIHVNHKTTQPFCRWNLEELAFKNYLVLARRADFKIADYPGYCNKRGDGSRRDKPFPLGKSSTFMFMFSETIKRTTGGAQNMNLIHLGSTNPRPVSSNVRWQPMLSHTQPALCRPCDVASENYGLPAVHVNARNDCVHLFGRYFDHAVATFGRTDHDASYNIREALRLGFERHTAERPGRPLNDYISILEELHRLSSLRLTRLRASYDRLLI